MNESYLTEEEIDSMVRLSNYIQNNPELIGTNQQLEELIDLNLKALRMDNPEEYPLKLIIAAFLTKIGGSFNIEPLEILDGLKKQIDEWRTN